MSLIEKFNQWFSAEAPDNKSFGALPEDPKPKTSPEEAIARLVCMDIEMYPNAWEYKKNADCYIILENREANVVVKINELPFSRSNEHCRVNGIEIGKKRGEEIRKAFDNRNMASLIEKLLDRVEKVETVSYEKVVEEARPKTVDPFAPPPIEKLAKCIASLKDAEEKGRKMLPPPKKIITMRQPKLSESSAKVKLLKSSPQTFWKGKSVKELNSAEFQDMCNYMNAMKNKQPFQPGEMLIP